MMHHETRTHNSPSQTTASHTRLHGPWLWLARAAWALVVVWVVIILAELIPVNMRMTYSEWYVQQARPALSDTNNYWGFIRYLTFLESAVGLLAIIMGLIVFRYRSDDWMGLFAQPPAHERSLS